MVSLCETKLSEGFKFLKSPFSIGKPSKNGGCSRQPAEAMVGQFQPATVNMCTALAVNEVDNPRLLDGFNSYEDYYLINQPSQIRGENQTSLILL